MPNHDDFIALYPNALPDELCDQLIQVHTEHSGVFQGRTGAGVDLSKKNSRDLTLDAHPELKDLKMSLLRHTFEQMQRYFKTYSMALCGAVSVNIDVGGDQSVTLTPNNFDEYGADRIGDIFGYLYRSGSINIQRYECEQGGYPHWHSEHYPQSHSTDSLHRVLLYMYYLNDVEQGGETEFYYQQRKIKPRKGTMVIAPAGFTHTHRGNTPISNSKYIATSWIMFNPAQRLYS